MAGKTRHMVNRSGRYRAACRSEGAAADPRQDGAAQALGRRLPGCPEGAAAGLKTEYSDLLQGLQAEVGRNGSDADNSTLGRLTKLMRHNSRALRQLGDAHTRPRQPAPLVIDHCRVGEQPLTLAEAVTDCSEVVPSGAARAAPFTTPGAEAPSRARSSVNTAWEVEKSKLTAKCRIEDDINHAADFRQARDVHLQPARETITGAGEWRLS